MTEPLVNSAADRACDASLQEDSLARYRTGFPILSHTNYLISNSLGAVPAADGLKPAKLLRGLGDAGCRAWEDAWWTLAADLGDLVAPLIGARQGEVVFQPNVTLPTPWFTAPCRFPATRTRSSPTPCTFPRSCI